MDGSGAHDNLGRCDRAQAAAPGDRHAANAAAVEQHAPNLGFGEDIEIGPPPRRGVEIGGRRGDPLAVGVRDRQWRIALDERLIHVGNEAVSGTFEDAGGGQRHSVPVPPRHASDRQRPVRAVDG